LALQLPHGVRPDERGAIDWLVGGDVAATVIVDGYNVLYGHDPGTFTTSGSRNMLADHLARMRRGSGVARVVVVYDSDLPGDREVHVLPGGVELRFANEDELADDRIVELSAAAGANVVVVTSDRELRERSEAVGALTLWSESLVGWMAPRTT
jgi:predicted RNA-binding protein with PIN domain